MLKIVRAGDRTNLKYLTEMHQLRARVFRDRLGWPVEVIADGREVDQFDLPQAIYLLALDKSSVVIGNWRLLPSSGPTMIGTVWPQFLESLSFPSSDRVWEASRFAVDCNSENDIERTAQINRATMELFIGLTELCLLAGIKEIYTMYDMRIAKLLRRLNCTPAEVSAKYKVGNQLSMVGRFVTDEKMLSALRTATKIEETFVTFDMLTDTLFYPGFSAYPNAVFQCSIPPSNDEGMGKVNYV